MSDFSNFPRSSREDDSSIIENFIKNSKGEYDSRIYQEALIFENLQHVYKVLGKGGSGLHEAHLLLLSLSSSLYLQICKETEEVIKEYNIIHEKIVLKCQKEGVLKDISIRDQKDCNCLYGGHRCAWYECGEHQLRVYATMKIIILVQDVLNDNGMLFRKKSLDLGEAGGY